MALILLRGQFLPGRLLLATATALSLAPRLIFSQICTSGDCSDEVEKAKKAAENYKFQPLHETIFGKILKKEIPADIVYEDEKVKRSSNLRSLEKLKSTRPISLYPLH